MLKLPFPFVRSAAVLALLAAVIPAPASAQEEGAGASSPEVARFPGGAYSAEAWTFDLQRAGVLAILGEEGAKEKAFEALVSGAYRDWKLSLDPSGLAEPWLGTAEANVLKEDLAALRLAYGRVSVDEGEFSEEALRAEFEAKREEFSQPARASFRYIFLKGKDEAKRARAEEALASVRGASTFSEAANKFSEASLMPKDLVVGPAPEEGMFPAMADQLFRELEPGEVSEVIELPTGFAILRLESRLHAYEPEFDAQQRRLAALRLTEKARMADLGEEVDRVRRHYVFETPEMDFRKFAPLEGDAETFRFEGAGGTAMSLPFVKAMLARDLRFVRDKDELAAALDDIAGELRERDALATLLEGRISPEDGPARRERALRDQKQLALAYEHYEPSEQDAAKLHGAIVERLRRDRSVFRGRALYIRPGQRAAEGDAGKIVPMSEVWDEIAELRTRIAKGELTFDEAIQARGTDPENKARGGAVSSDDATLPDAIREALRAEIRSDRPSRPVRLADGLALVVTDAEEKAYPEEPGALDWMVETLLPSYKRQEALAAHRAWFRDNLLEIDQEAAEAHLARLMAGRAPTAPEKATPEESEEEPGEAKKPRFSMMPVPKR